MASTRQVKVELLDVVCRKTEDSGIIGSYDEFYIAGSVRIGRSMARPVLTQKIDIDDGQTKTFGPGPLPIFEASLADDQWLYVFLRAYDEDSGKDWDRWNSAIDRAQQAFDRYLQDPDSTEDDNSITAQKIWTMLIDAIQWIGSMDDDDLLGSMSYVSLVGGIGDPEVRTWTFADTGGPFSSWDYDVHYRVTVTGGFRTEWLDGSLLREPPEPTVYVIFGNGKFAVPSAAILPMYGSPNDVQVVPPGNMEAIPRVPQTFTLLRESSSSDVYVIMPQAGTSTPDREKRRLVHPTDWEGLLRKFGGWEKVRVVHDGALSDIPTGPDQTMHPRDKL